MYIFAKLHPHLKEAESEDYNGTWFSSKDMARQIKRFYEGRYMIPLCIDHRDVNKFGFVRPDDVVGRVLDLFCNKENELMVKCQLDPKHAGYREVTQSIFNPCADKREKWGVSVGIALRLNENGKRQRNLVHVALTTDPGFAAYNTYLFKWALSEDVMNVSIARDYIEGAKVLTPEFAAKIKGIF